MVLLLPSADEADNNAAEIKKAAVSSKNETKQTDLEDEKKTADTGEIRRK